MEYEGARENLDIQANSIRAGRQEIFNENDLNIGQMVGPNGTMYKVNLAANKAEATKYLSDIANQVINTFNTNEVRSSFSDQEHKRHQKILFNMLEGCK